MRNAFLKVGACLCAVVGLFYGVLITPEVLIEDVFRSEFRCVLLVCYTLLAFVPFILFVFPGRKASRWPIMFGGAAVEVLVVGLFIWNFFDMMRD